MVNAMRISLLRHATTTESGQLSAIGARVFRAETLADAVEYFVHRQELDVTGLSTMETMVEAAKLVGSVVDVPTLRFDYVPSLRAEANALFDAQKEELAVTVVVTGLEHVVNDVLGVLMVDAGYGDKHIAKSLRFGFFDKVGWLWTELVGAPLPETLRKSVVRAVEVRNGFVHMKVDRTMVRADTLQTLSLGVDDGCFEAALDALDGLVSLRRDRLYGGFDREAFVGEQLPPPFGYAAIARPGGDEDTDN